MRLQPQIVPRQLLICAKGKVGGVAGQRQAGLSNQQGNPDYWDGRILGKSSQKGGIL